MATHGTLRMAVLDRASRMCQTGHGVAQGGHLSPSFETS
jgi:hypothetical protein